MYTAAPTHGPRDIAAIKPVVSAKKTHHQVRELAMERRKNTMGLDSLRPWDLGVDPIGRPALRPFETADEFKDGQGLPLSDHDGINVDLDWKYVR